MTGVPVSAEGPSHPSPESAADLLKRAAKRLEELACGASVSPWVDAVHAGDPDHFSNVIGGAGFPLFSSSCCNGNCYGHVTLAGDSAWITMLDPSVAPPLTAWLLAEARFVRRNFHTMHGQVEHLPSMRFARQVLEEEAS